MHLPPAHYAARVLFEGVARKQEQEIRIPKARYIYIYIVLPDAVTVTALLPRTRVTIAVPCFRRICSQLIVGFARNIHVRVLLRFDKFSLRLPCLRV